MERKKQQKKGADGTSGTAPRTRKAPSSRKARNKSHWLLVGGAVLALLASLLVYQYGHSSSTIIDADSHGHGDRGSGTDPQSADSTPPKKKKEEVVTYDGYIDLALAKQWSPVDPVEKLMSIAVTYNQMFDLQHTDPTSSSEHLLGMVEKEFKFVLNVLLHSKDSSTRSKAPKFIPTFPQATAVQAHDASAGAGQPTSVSDSVSEQYIDLTPVLFEAIAGVHRGIVRAGKQTLQNQNQNNITASTASSGGGGAVITRQEAEAASMKYQYNLVFALFRLVNQVTTPSHLLKQTNTDNPASTISNPAVAFSHLFIDLERRLGRYSQGALGSAVSLGLYRLYEPLVMLGADCAEALVAAVRNGDDLSLSMLLHLAHSSSQTQTRPSGKVKALSLADLTHALAVARTLQFPHLASRLEEALQPGVQKKKRSPDVPFFNEFLSIQSTSSTPLSSGGEDVACLPLSSSTTASHGEYLRFNLVPAGGTILTEGNGYDSDKDRDTITPEEIIQVKRDDKETQTQTQTSSLSSSQLCNIDVLHASSLNITTVTEQYLRMGRPLVVRGLLQGAIAGGGWGREAMTQLDRSIKVTPNWIPYGDQLTGSLGRSSPSGSGGGRAKAVPLRTYMDIMREYSLRVQAWVEAAQELEQGSAGAESNKTARCFQLSAFGGLKNTTQFLNEAKLPLYVFDNKILPSTTPLTDLAASPFPPSGRGIVSENPEEERRGADVDPGFALLDQLIAAASAATYGSGGGKGSVPGNTLSPQSFTRQFFAGPPLSGAPFHYHGPAFNALLHGRKLWHLLPPGRDLYSNIPPVQWAAGLEESERLADTDTEVEIEVRRRRLYPYLHPYGSAAQGVVGQADVLPCFVHQLAGDVLFVPNMWSHQITNLEETIGFATEVHAST